MVGYALSLILDLSLFEVLFLCIYLSDFILNSCVKSITQTHFFCVIDTEHLSRIFLQVQ